MEQWEDARKLALGRLDTSVFSVLHRLGYRNNRVKFELPQRARLWQYWPPFRRQDYSNSWTLAEVEHSKLLQSSSTIEEQFKTFDSFRVKEMVGMTLSAHSAEHRASARAEFYAKNKKGDAFAQTRMNPIARLLLLGHSDGNSSLSVLPKEVLSLVFRYVQSWWRQCVTVGGHISKVGIYASVISELRFPAPTGINVNMMPIMLGALATVLRTSRS